MDESMQEVRFDLYCKLCIHKDLPEAADPCNECLEIGMREGSRKPEHFDPGK